MIIKINDAPIFGIDKMCSPEGHCVTLTSGYKEVVDYAIDSYSSWDHITQTYINGVHAYVGAWQYAFKHVESAVSTFF